MLIGSARVSKADGSQEFPFWSQTRAPWGRPDRRSRFRSGPPRSSHRRASAEFLRLWKCLPPAFPVGKRLRIHSSVERLRASRAHPSVLRQELLMTSANDLAQLAPWKYEEAVGTTSIGWGDLDHDADKIRIGVVTLSLNDLFGTVKYDVGKLPDVQLPRGGRNRLHLNQRVPTTAIDRHDIVRRHVASERRGDESAAR